jgi:dipeptidyl aminopeptidase/acylaminoacyl peptidase
MQSDRPIWRVPAPRRRREQRVYAADEGTRASSDGRAKRRSFLHQPSLLMAVLVFAGGDQARAAFPDRNGEIAFSPNGRRLLFVRAEVQAGQVYDHVWVMRGDGTHLRRLTNGRVGDSSPAFSADGDSIVFERDANIWVMDAGGRHRRMIATRGGYPTFAPKGHIVGYTDMSGDHHQIVLINLDTGKRTQLTLLVLDLTHPRAVSATASHASRPVLEDRLIHPRPDMRRVLLEPARAAIALPCAAIRSGWERPPAVRTDVDADGPYRAETQL